MKFVFIFQIFFTNEDELTEEICHKYPDEVYWEESVSRMQNLSEDFINDLRKHR